MALRDMVTGSDACTTNDGAGPSNAFAGLANTLLGTSSKDQERLKEIPGFHGLPGTSEARFRPQRPEEAAMAAANGEPLQIPGLFNGRQDRQNGLHAGPGFQQELNWHEEFAGIPGGIHQGPQSQAGVAPFLQAFLSTARGQPHRHPTLNQKLDLSVRDQCQIRDRSTILARHLSVDRGDAAADEQVFRLLQSLRIDPRALPNEASQEAWNGIHANGVTRGQAGLGHDMALQNRARMDGPDVDRWADQFSNLNFHDEAQGWVDNFEAQDREHPHIPANAAHQAVDVSSLLHKLPEGKSRAGAAMWPHEKWVEQFGEEGPVSSADLPPEKWVEEFGTSQEQAAAPSEQQAANRADALQQTRALRDTLASSQDPKFQKSKFLQFVSKMSRGEIILEDNQAKEVVGGQNEWANEFTHRDDFQKFERAYQDANGVPAASSSWAEEFHGRQDSPAGWADQFHEQMHPPDAWADQFEAQNGAEQWVEDFAASRDQGLAQGLGAGDQEYVMAVDNPFLSDLSSFAKGKELFRDGLLSEARLALEAEVQRQPGNVEAWRLLGTVHAENDNDQQAIAALNKALLASPGNAEVLLSLGVSYTNELDQRRAIAYLMEWLKLQPHQRGAASVQLPGDSREKLRVVSDIFQNAAQMNKGSADAHVALGVLCNLSRNYDGAVDAFRQALQTRSSDYSLWNKLGATLANSGRSSEAIDAYQKALELKPNYMRAWVNMGISQANIGEYEASIRFYGRALTLNPQAAPVWSYLRTSVTCAGREELLQAVEDEDAAAITQALPL